MAIGTAAVPSSQGTNAAQFVSCSSSHAANANDCRNLINTYLSDQTPVIGDSNQRAVLTFGGCSIVLKFGANEIEQTTRANLAAKANIIDQVCDAGTGFSGVLQGDAVRNDKYCLCSPSTVTAC